MMQRQHLITGLLAIGLLWTASASAEPAPFGLVLGQSTKAEIASRYALTPSGINRHSGGEMFDLDPRARFRRPAKRRAHHDGKLNQTRPT